MFAGLLTPTFFISTFHLIIFAYMLVLPVIFHPVFLLSLLSFPPPPQRKASRYIMAVVLVDILHVCLC